MHGECLDFAPAKCETSSGFAVIISMKTQPKPGWVITGKMSRRKWRRRCCCCCCLEIKKSMGKSSWKLMGKLVTCLKQRHLLGGFEQDGLLRTSCHGGLFSIGWSPSLKNWGYRLIESYRPIPWRWWKLAAMEWDNMGYPISGILDFTRGERTPGFDPSTVDGYVTY